MSDLGWLVAVPLQFAPGDAPLLWYGAGFVLALLFAGSLIGLWLTRTESRKQPPIDHEGLLNAFDEPMVVLDSEDVVLVANVAFRGLFDTSPVGKSIEDALESAPTVSEAITERKEVVVEIVVNGEPRHYKVCNHFVGKEPRPPRKLVVQLHDVTDEYEHQSHLEDQKEQLEQFASLVSHDLRNPLDVAIGHTNAVASELDDPALESHLTRVRESHDRMKQIINDVLALAREGHSIGDVGEIPLETAVMDAWSHVDTKEAKLRVETQQVIRADREAVTRVFENLFRNAVQHGSEGVTVTIRPLERASGFVVADDGEGISPSVRDRVLETGFSEGSNGTGLGLAIVSSIVQAHDWELTVTESDAGGACFEISGVELVANDSSPQTE